MDDDDFYPPCRVSHAVDALIKSGAPLAGSSKMFMYFCKDRSIYQLGPYRENHGTAATLAYTKEFASGHFYFDPSNGHYAEEGVFTEGWKHPMVQLDPMKTVLALSHTDNTIEKTMFLDEKMGNVGRTVNNTELKVSDYRIVPMIDARRNEVFTAVYDAELNMLASPFACILHEDAFAAFSDKKLVFSGGGSVKWKSQCKQRDCYFPDIDFNASCMATIAKEKFDSSEFTPVEVAVPFYLKEFQVFSSPAPHQ
jgi:hypothetical protein